MSAGISLALFHTPFSGVALVIESVNSPEAGADTIHEISMDSVVGCCQPIVGELRVPLDLDETSISQTSQMTRHQRLRKIENLMDVAHAQLTCGEHVEYPDSCRHQQPPFGRQSQIHVTIDCIYFRILPLYSDDRETQTSGWK